MSCYPNLHRAATRPKRASKQCAKAQQLALFRAKRSCFAQTCLANALEEEDSVAKMRTESYGKWLKPSLLAAWAIGFIGPADLTPLVRTLGLQGTKQVLQA